MRDVKDMGQMGYRSLDWNWPKEAMNRPTGAGIAFFSLTMGGMGLIPERLKMMMMISGLV